MRMKFSVDKEKLSSPKYQLKLCKMFFNMAAVKYEEEEDEYGDCEDDVWWLYDGLGASSPLTQDDYYLQHIETVGGEGEGSEVSEVWALLKNEPDTEFYVKDIEYYNTHTAKNAICYVSASGCFSSYGETYLEVSDLQLVNPKAVTYCIWK